MQATTVPQQTTQVPRYFAVGNRCLRGNGKGLAVFYYETGRKIKRTLDSGETIKIVIRLSQAVLYPLVYLHHVCVRKLEGEESDVEQQRECAVFLCREIGVFQDTHDSGIVHWCSIISDVQFLYLSSKFTHVDSCPGIAASNNKTSTERSSNRSF